MDQDQNILSEMEGAVEDAARLQFPSAFDNNNAVCVSLSEVKLLTCKRMDDEKKHGFELNDVPKVITESLEYSRQFSHFNSEQGIVAARTVLSGAGLHGFEVAQIMNLMPKSAEEAVSLIPSLRPKLSDDQIESLLLEVSQWMTADIGTMGEEQQPPPPQQLKEEDFGME